MLLRPRREACTAGVPPAVSGASRSRRILCHGHLGPDWAGAGCPCHSGRDARGTLASTLSVVLFSSVVFQGQSCVINLKGACRHRCLIQREIVVTQSTPEEPAVNKALTVVACSSGLGAKLVPRASRPLSRERPAPAASCAMAVLAMPGHGQDAPAPAGGTPAVRWLPLLASCFSQAWYSKGNLASSI